MTRLYHGTSLKQLRAIHAADWNVQNLRVTDRENEARLDAGLQAAEDRSLPALLEFETDLIYDLDYKYGEDDEAYFEAVTGDIGAGIVAAFYGDGQDFFDSLSLQDRGAFVIPAGVPLYHGSPEPTASIILQERKLLGRSKYKMGSGVLTEGGMIWFARALEDGEWWATGPEAHPPVPKGRVFKFTPTHDLVIIPRTMPLTSQEAALFNTTLLPAYKSVRSREGVDRVVYRAFDSTRYRDLEKYQTPRGTMVVIWPIVLAALGAHGFSYHDGIHIAIAADSLEVEPATLGGWWR